LRSSPHLPTPRHPYYQPSDTPFTVTTLITHISPLPSPSSSPRPSLKDKSPGPSGVTFRFLQHCGTPLITIFHHLLTQVWNLHTPHTSRDEIDYLPSQWSRNLLSLLYKPDRVHSDPHNLWVT
jgi:hypothetical protein